MKLFVNTFSYVQKEGKEGITSLRLIQCLFATCQAGTVPGLLCFTTKAVGPLVICRMVGPAGPSNRTSVYLPHGKTVLP
ncbi:hypothetical protein MHYP_G00136830 [Metynnis hypsauchen]